MAGAPADRVEAGVFDIEPSVSQPFQPYFSLEGRVFVIEGLIFVIGAPVCMISFTIPAP